MVAAAGYSPFWAERFRVAGVDPANVGSEDDLRRVPPVREADIVAAGGRGAPALLMRPTESQVKATASGSTVLAIARRIRSDGISGKRLALLQEFKPIHVHHAGRDGELVVAYSRSDLDRLHRTGKRAASVIGLDEGDYLVSVVSPRSELAYWGVYHLALGSSILALHAGGGVEDVVRSFGLVPATAVAVETAEAVELAAMLLESDVDLDRVRRIVLVGPPPSSEERTRITQAFRAAGAHADVKAMALWAPSEARALWAECGEGVTDGASTGLHTYPDLELLELVNPVTGRATEPGGQPLDRDGDLTYTSVGWHGTALVRYQTGDYVERLTTEPCDACGRTVARIEGELVPGAWQPALKVAGGLARADLRGAAVVLGNAQGVAAWRLELRKPTTRVKHDRVIIEVVADPDRTPGLEARLTSALGVEPTSVTYVDDRDALQAKVEDVGGIFADLR